MVRFGLVGIFATGIHYCVAVALMTAKILPLVANVGAFAIAFLVSFTGHYFWSFAVARTGVGGRRALVRFLTVSLVGFTLNEALFASLLQWTPLHPHLGLLVVLFLVAGLTFVSSRFWAFAIQDETAPILSDDFESP